MNKISKYFKISLISQVREPLSTIFGLLFPILMMTLFVSTLSPSINTESFKFIDKYFFIAISFVVLPNVFISIPMAYCYDVHMGFLKQMKCFGANIKLFKTIDFLVSILIIYFEMIIVTIIGYIFFDLTIFSFIDMAKFYLFLLPCIISLSLFSISLISWIKKPNTYMGLGISLMMVALMFSGGMGIEVSKLGPVVEKIANFIPTKHVIESGYLIWQGESLNLTEYLNANIIIIAISLFLGVVYFYFQKKRKNS